MAAYTVRYLGFLLNIPWTLIGLVAALASYPSSVKLSASPFAFIFQVRSFWWYSWLPGKKGVRAIANGNVIQLTPEADDADLKHELVHVEQYEREPFIHPFLYLTQSWKHGYRQNKYEEEAYSRVGNRYVG